MLINLSHSASPPGASPCRTSRQAHGWDETTSDSTARPLRANSLGNDDEDEYDEDEDDDFDDDLDDDSFDELEDDDDDDLDEDDLEDDFDDDDDF